MSYSGEEAYRAMLASFRTNDLQALLGAFGRNKTGRKSELKDRAIELLRIKPVGFNRPAYLAKIVEIYHTMQSDMPNNDMLRTMVQGQRQMPMNLQSQQQRTFQPQQYTHQQMHMTRSGLPPLMPQMQRSMYGNNNIQYNYQSNGPRNVPVNQQQNMVQHDPMSYNINAPTSADSNPLPSYTQSLANIRLKKLPFYQVIDDVVKPVVLTGQERCTLQNVPRGMRETTFKLVMLMDHVNHISMNRDISNGKNEYIYQLQIRICLLEAGATEINDYMPLGLHIRVCNKTCPLPPTAPNTRPGTEARRISRPINCTQLLKLNPNIANTITINWNPDGKTYIIAMYLVKKLSSDCLLQKLKDKGARSSEETKNYIIRKLVDVDPDLATTSYRFSLMCPLGKMRMNIPAKSVKCEHLQCFDASTFILMNEKKPTWMCPSCNKPCLYDDIQIESYFLNIVSDPNLPDGSNEIEFLADGTWKVYEENEEACKGAVSKEKIIESVNLDDSSDDDNSPEVKKESNPESSKEPDNLKSSFVDLTLSDSDEPPTEKDKQENEAQAVDVIQPVTTVDSEPQAQVQPQQAVTSSEQGVVIEIDSPSPPVSPKSSTTATAPTSTPTPTHTPPPTPPPTSTLPATSTPPPVPLPPTYSPPPISTIPPTTSDPEFTQ